MKHKNEAIILVHGIWMTGLELFYLRFKFYLKGYRVYTFHYHSLLSTPVKNAEKLDRFINKINLPVVHIVAHSLGGIVVCHLFNKYEVTVPGKVILLASPINGSAVARTLAGHRLLKYLLGKSVHKGLLERGSAWNCQRPTCVISGSKKLGVGQFFARQAMQAVNDGTVNLEETVLAQAAENYIVSQTHFSMLYSNEVFKLMLGFLTKN